MCRTLVLIVAYDAERHIESLLERVPEECFDAERYHLLCIDDSSSDRSAELATRWLREHRVDNATVLRNPVNQGYGGNQKLGYRYAVDAGFDLVILLHGDSQYAPEILPRFVEIFERTGAGVILGSRMRDVSQATAGGMPFYKILGNRVLTGLQNLITGRDLSEYHTGYRAYSRDFLTSVPFEILTNDFHFDSEILLQAFTARERIEEFGIPTYYGDEICHVNGLRYAWSVMASTITYRMHHLGMLCSLKYRNLGSARYHDKSWMPYSSHSRTLAVVRRAQPYTLLDLGCGPGHVARLCEEMGARVTGIDREQPLPETVSHFLAWDLEQTPLPLDAFAFDLVLILDLVEHLENPEEFLLSLRNASEQSTGGEAGPRMVITTPNVAFAAVRLNLLFGRFNYAERGILDITHKRLFTRRSLVSMLEDCGYRIERVEGIGVPFGAVMGGRMGTFLGWISDFFARLWPSLWAFQFLVVCRPVPGVRQLLQDSEPFLRHEADEPAAVEAS
ncbi:MAG: glycosyltransferase [bacterium]|nr:glycosyltransferase [bacterium]